MTEKREQDDFIMLPTNDFCFKELMRTEKVRRGFIAALLGVSPESVEGTELMDTILDGDYPDDKEGIVDVRVRLTDGSQMEMEMQVASVAYWTNRIIFYLSRMYTDQIKRGDEYDRLKKCMHISILDFDHFPENDRCYRTISLCDEETGERYSDLLQIKVLELRKLAGQTPTDSSIYDWMRFFSGKTKEDIMETSKVDEYLKAACEELERITANDEMRAKYYHREKTLRDYISQMHGEYERGVRDEQKKSEETIRSVQEENDKTIRSIQEENDKRIKLTKDIYKMKLSGKSDAEIAEACHVSEKLVYETLN